MIRHRVDPERPSPQVISAAAEVIRRGGLVAFPTETVYGLGADALSEAAILALFAAKGRPSYNPIIAHVASADHALTLVTHWPAAAGQLAATFWPGPLTLVLPKAPHVPLALTAGRDTVAVRMPAHPVALALIRTADRPIAAPSANRFTELSPTTADHVERGLGAHVEMILDSGPTPVGIESTVVDLSGLSPVLLRPGTLSRAALEQVLGVPLADPVPAAHATEARPAPGMTDRHYAPRARVMLTQASGVAAVITREIAAGKRVGAIVIGADATGTAALQRLSPDAAGYARGLYAALHAMDEAACDIACVELPPDAPEWAGVNDRLRRAAHPPEHG
ncbi:MAG: L-threonylcarbamoyladenylate synthase [Gemmatimonadaceae bacterium]|nr:L-threonylcarbamoyladenylate synthase [Gemmatimonadaceae bacterium]